MKEQIRPPEGSGYLISNLYRRQKLLERIRKPAAEDGETLKSIPEIVIKDTLLKFLNNEYKKIGTAENRAERIHDLNRRIFILLNRAASLADKKQDTAPVTAMYAVQRKGAVKITEETLSEYLSQVKKIIELCKEYNVSIKSITGMQTGLGVPKEEDLKRLLNWCKENQVDLRSITGMQMGLGVPKEAGLNRLLKWCRDNNVDIQIITALQRGIPSDEELAEILAKFKAV